jgi:putative transposase
LLKAIKRPYSFRIKQLLEKNRSRLLERLTIRQRPGVMTFRYWQEGPGYDRNIESEAAVLAAIDYIHLNPVRRKLCDHAIDWRWSSIRFHLDPTTQADPALPKLHSLPPEFFRSAASPALSRRHCWTSQQWHPVSASSAIPPGCHWHFAQSRPAFS